MLVSSRVNVFSDLSLLFDYYSIYVFLSMGVHARNKYLISYI